MKKSQKKCYICQIEFCYDKNEKKKFKLYKKVRDHCHYARKFRGAAHSICNLRYKVPQEILVKIHNGSKYDYHFIIRELAEELKVNLSVQEKIQKNILPFQYQLKKKMIMVKQLHTKQNILILADSCKENYQALLITCLKVIIKIAKNAWKEKKQIRM